jgi:hypothetical protein
MAELSDFGPPMAIASWCGERLVTIRADADGAAWIVEDGSRPLRTERLDAMAQVWRTSHTIPPTYWIVAGAAGQMPEGAVKARLSRESVGPTDGPGGETRYEVQCGEAGWLIALPACADLDTIQLSFHDKRGRQVDRTFRLGPPLSVWLGDEGEWTSYGPSGADR